MAAIAISISAAIVTALLILALRPLLQRYALARPNARSSHKVPTPQGGGIAIVAAWIAVSSAAFMTIGWPANPGSNILVVFAATVLIAALGAVDDIRPIAVIPRLLFQFVAVGAIIAILPFDFQMTAFLPFWIERALLVLAGVWFVNLVNFMDGLDWMTVAEMVPVAGGLVVLGAMGALPAHAIVCALALFGALIGFAPFNQPVARLFLGDVGSLPLGLIVGWLLALLADGGHLAAALLLPLYYLMDATLTLLRRLSKGERVWQAHRTHFYQRATDHGFTVMQVVAHVFALNILLVLLALLCIVFNKPVVEIAALAAGIAVTALLLWRFSRPRRCAS